MLLFVFLFPSQTQNCGFYFFNWNCFYSVLKRSLFVTFSSVFLSLKCILVSKYWFFVFFFFLNPADHSWRLRRSLWCSEDQRTKGCREGWGERWLHGALRCTADDNWWVIPHLWQTALCLTSQSLYEWWDSHFRSPQSSQWECELIPVVLSVPHGVATATALNLDNGCSFLSKLPFSCLCFLVLFSKKEVCSQRLPASRTQLCANPYMDLSGH